MFVNRRGRDGRIFWTVGRAEAAVDPSPLWMIELYLREMTTNMLYIDRFLSNSISLSEYISGMAAHTNLWIPFYLFCYCQYFPI